MQSLVVRAVGVLCAATLSLAGSEGTSPAVEVRSVARQMASAELQVVDETANVVHRRPVDALVVDPFREPEHAFGPGNRGIEYGTNVGQPVVASSHGTVSFAGSVAGNLFVTIDHGGGLVTTVGFLSEIRVGRGETVEQGQRLGDSGTTLHFSARQDGDYFDPELLFAEFAVVVRLVPAPK